VDPLGGINTLWPLFGIANQMLAGIALIFASVALVKMKRERYVWVTLLPTAWLLACTLTAAWQKLWSADTRIGFLAHAREFSAAAARHQLLAPATSLEQMQRVIFNDRVDAALAAAFAAVLLCMAWFGLRAAARAWGATHPTTTEAPHVPLPA
jgi:carbon starvation protein